jgi:hypothetical protein
MSPIAGERMTGKTMAREAGADAASGESSSAEMDAAGAEAATTTPHVEAATTAMEATAAAVSAPTAAVPAGRRIGRHGCSQRPAGQKSESKFAFKFAFHVTPLFELPHLPHVWRHPSKTKTASRGYGVALGRTPLVDAEIKSGQLVHLFDHSVPSGWCYWLVTMDADFQSHDVKTFRQWLLDELGAKAQPGSKQKAAGGNRLTLIRGNARRALSETHRLQ